MLGRSRYKYDIVQALIAMMLGTIARCLPNAFIGRNRHMDISFCGVATRCLPNAFMGRIRHVHISFCDVSSRCLPNAFMGRTRHAHFFL